MSHPADGEAWQDFNRKHPTFADDPMNLRFAVATDGFNPFGNFSSTYSDGVTCFLVDCSSHVL
jgi:hypothetical protein